MDYIIAQNDLTLKANEVSNLGKLTDDLVQRYLRAIDYIRFQKELENITEDATVFIGPSSARIRMPLSKYLGILLTRLNMTDADVAQLQDDLNLATQVVP